MESTIPLEPKKIEIIRMAKTILAANLDEHNSICGFGFSGGESPPAVLQKLTDRGTLRFDPGPRITKDLIGFLGDEHYVGMENVNLVHYKIQH